MKVCSEFEWQQKSRLLDDRNRLRRLFADLRVAATSRDDYEPHDVTDDEAAIQADAIEGRLAAVDGAIDRIDSGGYGVCLECQLAIPTERLEALPATAVCLSCAA